LFAEGNHLNITEGAQMFVLHNFVKSGLGHILGNFYKNLSGTLFVRVLAASSSKVMQDLYICTISFSEQMLISNAVVQY
jgi:hypothetical protein